MRFDPEFVGCVLEQNFEDAKAFFLAPLMAIHYAHLVMLIEQRIVARSDGQAIASALDAVPLADVGGTRYDGTYEDLFFFIDRLLIQSIGEDTAGRLHTARSRNDIDMTMYRMRQRELILALVDEVQRLRGTLLDVADAHRHHVFPAHTHTQPAQPTTVTHYLLAVIEQVERDTSRLQAAYDRTNVSPLGSCAITGTGFPIDRGRTAALLGFSGASGNTYGSIATVDYLLESVSAAAVLLAGLGRVVQDFLLWCTAEVGYLRLADGFVQCSSIMPQKRNPVALEHARAIASKALGQASAVLLTVHNTPFGDIVDTEDDLQPLVFGMFKDAVRAVRLVASAMASAGFDEARMARRATEGWITVTELADTLTRDHGVAFKTSHRIAARLVQESSARPDVPPATLLTQIAASLGATVSYSREELASILSPARFVEVRRTPGGPAPEETARASAVSRQRLADDGAWLGSATSHLRTAEAELKAAVGALMRE